MGIQTDPVEIKIKRGPVGRPRTTPFGPQLKSNPVGRPARPTNLSGAQTPLQEEILPQENSKKEKIKNKINI